MTHRLRHLARTSARILAVVAAVVLLAVAGLYARLVSGPIDTPVPQRLLDRLVAEAAPGWRIETGRVRLDLSSDDGLNGLRLHDVALIDAEGNSVVSALRLGLRFALSASFDPGKVLEVREVSLSGATVEVLRDKTGKFQFDIGSGVESANSEAPLAALMRDGVLDMLPRLRIENATVVYSDLARDMTWRTEHARLTLDPSSEGLAGKLAMAVEGDTGNAVLTAFLSAETGEAEATLKLNRVTPPTIAGIHPVLAELRRMDAPLSGSVTAAFAADGSVRTLESDLNAGDGVVHLADGPSKLKSLSARLSCDSAARACTIAELAVESPELVSRVSGKVVRSEAGIYRGTLVVGETTVKPRHSGPFGFAGGMLTADYDDANGAVSIEKALAKDLTLPDGVKIELAELSGSVETDSLTGTVDQWRLASVLARIGDGGHLSVEAATGSAVFDGEAVAIADLESGPVSFTEGGQELHGIDRLTGEGRYSIAENLLSVSIDAAGASATDPSLSDAIRVEDMSVTGAFDLAARALSESTVTVGNATLTIPDLYDAPVGLSQADVSLSGAVTAEGLDVTIHKASATLDGLPAKANGAFSIRTEGGFTGEVAASLGPVDFSRVPGHWPKPVAPGGFRWVRENVKRGQVEYLTVKAGFDSVAPEKDTLDVAFGFRDTDLTFAPGMPPITGARGKGTVTLDRLDLKLSGGQIAVPGAGRLRLAGSEFTIADFAPDIPDGNVKLRAKGGIRSVLRLLDTEPLGVITPTGFDIGKASGEADVQVVMALPLAADLSVEDVQFDARAKVHEYALIEPRTGAAIAGDLMLVKAKPDGLALESDARIDGLAARIGYRQEFERQPEGSPDSVLTLESFLSLEDFARNGFDLSEYVSGLTAMDARIDLFDSGLARFTADADLTNLALKADRIGWRKASGIPATVKFTGSRKPDGTGKIEALSLRGKGMTADGTLVFDGQGAIRFAQFSQIALGRALDIGLRYVVQPEGPASLRIEGPHLDLRTAFATAIDGQGKASETAEGKTGSTTEISMNVGRVVLRDDLSVIGARGAVRLRGGGLRAANIEGNLNGKAPAKLLAESRSDGLALRLTSSDGGGFVRAAGLFDGAYDGRLMLDARTTETVTPSRIRGVIRLDDVTVGDSKTMREIFSGGAIASLIRDMASDGLRFEKIQMPFTGVGSLWKIEDGVAYGPSLGLTLDGSYDLTARKLDLHGSVSPAYAINGALGKVPLLGKILTGGEGEGVFGVTFSVEGDSGHPAVSVNPLSALAPGFLRKIVAEVGKGGGGGRVAPRPPNRRNDK